uniref:Homeobox domain-containing protein n=1 Tax=Globodera pallida TaxID=36090 RepID=A0A183C9Q5_GLOPA
MESIALCVGMEKEMCYMMYGDKLADSVEMRGIFEGVKVGQWFRQQKRHRLELAKAMEKMLFRSNCQFSLFPAKMAKSNRRISLFSIRQC